MALTLTNNIGEVGLRFSTPISGRTQGGVVRVVSGPARVGSEGLIIDQLPLGVSTIIVRETVNGTATDTTFSVFGADLADEQAVPLALTAKGMTDAQARATIGGASSLIEGLRATGLLFLMAGFLPIGALTFSDPRNSMYIGQVI